MALWRGGGQMTPKLLEIQFLDFLGHLCIKKTRAEFSKKCFFLEHPTPYTGNTKMCGLYGWIRKGYMD